jgi:hypothetical protein
MLPGGARAHARRQSLIEGRRQRPTWTDSTGARHPMPPSDQAGVTPGSCSRVLHALRRIGAAGVEPIATASGLSRHETERCLHNLGDDGLAGFDQGPFGGWALTDRGRAADDEGLVRELERVGAREFVLDGYRRFLVLNPELLEICSDWQVRNIGGATILNDHRGLGLRSQGAVPSLSRRRFSAGPVDGTRRDPSQIRRLRRSPVVVLARVMAGNHAYLAGGPSPITPSGSSCTRISSPHSASRAMRSGKGRVTPASECRRRSDEMRSQTGGCTRRPWGGMVAKLTYTALVSLDDSRTSRVDRVGVSGRRDPRVHQPAGERCGHTCQFGYTRR